MKLTKTEKRFFNDVFKKNPYLKDHYQLQNADQVENGKNVKVLFHSREKQDFHFNFVVVNADKEKNFAYIQAGSFQGKEFFHITFFSEKDIADISYFGRQYDCYLANKEKNTKNRVIPLVSQHKD